MSILEERTYYKPFRYPFAYDLYKKAQAAHWLPAEVEFREDINDWNHKLTDSERSLLTQLFRFFTQADVDVAGGYRKLFGPKLGGHPEVAMMMSAFGTAEANHIDAYSTLIETVGMPEDTYQSFTQYKAMRDKHEYTHAFKCDTLYNTLKSLAVYSAFTEGMQLFASFAILMNFERFNKMKGMCNIVRWSIKDESLHVEGMTKLFKTLLLEHPEISTYDLREDIRTIATKMIALEDAFVDLCFGNGGITGITPEEIKYYIRFIAQKRWEQLGFNGQLGQYNGGNPLPWLDWVVNGTEHTNFFEARPTEYSKGSLTDDDEDAGW